MSPTHILTTKFKILRKQINKNQGFFILYACWWKLIFIKTV